MVKPTVLRNFIKDRDFLLAIVWGIYLVAGLLSYSAWAFTESGEPNSFGMVLKLTRYFVYLLCGVLIILFSKYKKKTLIYCLVLLLISAVTMVFSGNKMVLFIALMIMTFYGQSEEWLMRSSFTVTAVILFGIVLLSQVGIITDYVRTTEWDGRVRHFLGFSWATYSAVFFLFLVLEYIAIKKGKLCLRAYALFMILGFWLYIMTDSRFIFLISFGVLTFFLIFGKRLDRVRHKQFYNIFLIFPWLIAGGSILLHWLYNKNSDAWVRMDGVLSGRLLLGKNALLEYPLKLFGQNIEWVGWDMGTKMQGDYNYVDCSYLQVLLQEGIIFLIVLLILLTLLIKYAIVRKKYYLVWILLFVMLLSVTEPWMIASVAVNPFLLCLCNRDAKEPEPVVHRYPGRYRGNRFVLK